MTEPHETFDELVDRLRGQYEHVDVYAISREILDWKRRKPHAVRNAKGLLVSRVMTAARHRPVAIGTAADRAEQQSYAEFWVETLRLARAGLSPEKLAQRLSAARGKTHPRLNPFVIDALEQLGDAWPAAEVAC